MKRTWVAVGLGAALLLLAGTLWWLRPRDAEDEAPPAVSLSESEMGEIRGGEPLRLFYPGGDGLLHLEGRTVELPDPTRELEELRHARASSVVEGLLGAPQTDGLHPAFDPGTELDAVRLRAGGLAIVALRPAPGEVDRGAGSRVELLRVYSLVNSLAYSVPGVRSVIIVWAGRQPATLAGHVDTTHPLFPSLDWVAADSRDTDAAPSLTEAAADDEGADAEQPAPDPE